MAESTPLLDDIDENTEFEARSQTPASAYFKRPIRVLTIITLVLSAITVALLIANYIIIERAPFGYYTWSAREATAVLGRFMFVSVVFAVINVLVNLPILLNIIVDIVLIAGIIPWVVRLILGFPSSDWCAPGWSRPGYPAPQPHPKCKDWKFVVQILMGIAAGLGGIVSVIYLSQLVLRSIAIFRTKFWRRSAAWTFPTGQISFEINIKLLKQQSGNIGQSVEASSSSGHGPLHL